MSVKINLTQGILELEVRGDRLVYPFVWLLDNCQCPLCWDSGTKKVLLREIDVNIQPQSAEIKMVC